MYEIFCHAVDLLCQGLFTSVFIFWLAKWYDDKKSEQKFKAAAMFISFELSEHLMVLADMVAKKTMLQQNSSIGFSVKTWLEFRTSLVGHMPMENIQKATAYYRSISKMDALSQGSESYQQHEDIVISALKSAEYLCDLFYQASLEAGAKSPHSFSSRILAGFHQIQASRKKQ